MRYKDILVETLIIPGNKRFNQIVFVAGGTGSGKSFAIRNFTNIKDAYKVFDVDSLKELILSSKTLSKEFISFLQEYYPDKYSSVDNVEDLTLSDPDVVSALHKFQQKRGLSSKRKELFVNQLKIAHSQGKDLPNIAFDATLRDETTEQMWLRRLIDVGYNSNDVHLVWVLTDFKQAKANNENRKRRVPENVFYDIHLATAAHLSRILFDKSADSVFLNPKLANGEIYVILNNKQMQGSSFTYKKVRAKGGNWDSTALKHVYRWTLAYTPLDESTLKSIIKAPRIEFDF